MPVPSVSGPRDLKFFTEVPGSKPLVAGCIYTIVYDSFRQSLSSLAPFCMAHFVLALTQCVSHLIFYQRIQPLVGLGNSRTVCLLAGQRFV